jgi:hypothetical protein
MEARFRSIVAAKMMRFATLNQMFEFARRYSVNPEDARLFTQRMFHLASQNPDPQIWYGIRVAAYQLKVGDLEQQAQAKGDELAANRREQIRRYDASPR